MGTGDESWKGNSDAYQAGHDKIFGKKPPLRELLIEQAEQLELPLSMPEQQKEKE